MSDEPFEQMLTGGHPNSLGRTIEVVDTILANQVKLEELYQCYFSEDEIVRLRVSNAMKRIGREHVEWLVPYTDRLLTDISQINQASTQWTLANLFALLETFLSAEQKSAATAIMQHNLATHTDWIVLNNSMQTLFDWSKGNVDLQVWLAPHLERLSSDKRKSVAKRATKLLAKL